MILWELWALRRVRRGHTLPHCSTLLHNIDCRRRAPQAALAVGGLVLIGSPALPARVPAARPHPAPSQPCSPAALRGSRPGRSAGPRAARCGLAWLAGCGARPLLPASLQACTPARFACRCRPASSTRRNSSHARPMPSGEVVRPPLPGTDGEPAAEEPGALKRWVRWGVSALLLAPPQPPRWRHPIHPLPPQPTHPPACTCAPQAPAGARCCSGAGGRTRSSAPTFGEAFDCLVKYFSALFPQKGRAGRGGPRLLVRPFTVLACEYVK